MKKNSYFKFLLVFMLLFGPLVGCNNQQNSSKNGSQKSSTENVQTCQESNENSMDDVFKDLKTEQDKFIQNLTLAINNEENKNNIGSDALSQCIKLMQTKVESFRQSVLPTIAEAQRDKITLILDDMKQNLTDISDKIITPLSDENNRLNKTSIGEIQDNLKLNIPKDDRGTYGSKTKEEIEKFLSSKIDSLNSNRQDLHIQRIFDKLETLRANNPPAQNPYNLAFFIACLALIISIFSILNFDNIKEFITKLTEKPSNKPKKEPPTPTPNNNTDSDYFPISEQDYKQIYNEIYNEIYHQIYEPLNKKISNLDQPVDNRINPNIDDLKKRIEKLEKTTKTERQSPFKREEQRTSQNTRNVLQDTQQADSSLEATDTHRVSNHVTAKSNHTYNYTSNSLPSNTTEVSETEESLTNRRLGSSQVVILETKRRGNYLIYTQGGYNCLIPSQNLRINQYNYETIEALFECRDYNPDYSSDFKVLQPAVVYPLSNGQTWQLQEPGILQF